MSAVHLPIAYTHIFGCTNKLVCDLRKRGLGRTASAPSVTIARSHYISYQPLCILPVLAHLTQSKILHGSKFKSELVRYKYQVLTVLTRDPGVLRDVLQQLTSLRKLRPF